MSAKLQRLATLGAVAFALCHCGEVNDERTCAGAAHGCPTSVPVDRSCGDEGQICTYGSTPFWAGRAIAICSEGIWQSPQGDDDSDKPYDPAPACEEQPQHAATCGEKANCLYPDGSFCACAGPNATWWCQSGPEAGCPPFAPNAGDSCEESCKVCDYNGYTEPSGVLSGVAGLRVTCEGGVWVWSIEEHGGVQEGAQ